VSKVAGIIKMKTPSIQEFEIGISNFIEIMNHPNEEIDMEKAEKTLISLFVKGENPQRKKVLNHFEKDFLPVCLAEKEYDLLLDFFKNIILIPGENFKGLYLLMFKVIIAFMEREDTENYCMQLEDLFLSSYTNQIIGDYYRSKESLE
jgi:hypothetical protein